MQEICAVLLAAGQSSRMRNFNKLVSLLGGKPLVRYAVDNLRNASMKRIIAVVGHERERVKAAIGDGVEWIIQEEQLGTGHAAAQVLPCLSREDTIVILFGDCPFLTSDIIEGTINTHKTANAGITFATSRLRNPRSLGRVCRSADGKIERIAEHFYEDHPELLSPEVFVGLSVWRRDVLLDYIPRLMPRHRSEGHTETNLPDAIQLYVQDGGIVSSYSDISDGDAIAPNEPTEFDLAAEHLRSLVKSRLRSKGVLIPHPESLTVDYDVVVGEGTTLHEDTHLIGVTEVGRGCEIGPVSVLKNCKVGDNCTIGRGTWTNQDFPDGTRAFDRMATEQRHFHKAPYLIPDEPNTCFVIMPFHEPYLSLLSNIIRPTLKRHGIDCRTASNDIPGAIIEDIWVGINRSSLVLAEVSVDNSNVWYELGLAHALNKLTIIICDKDCFKRKLPFDIQQKRVIIYDPKKGDLSDQLSNWLKNIVGKGQ